MWIWLLTFGFSTALAAQKVSYPAQDIVLKNVKEIRIVGVRGSLRLTHKEGLKNKNKARLAVKHTRDRKSDDWYLSVERRGHTLFLEVFSTAYGKQWRKQVAQENWPEFDLALEGGSRPVTVSWREGDLDFSGWADDLDVSFLKGTARFRGGTGRLKLQAVRADVTVEDRKGSMSIQGESGRVKMNNVQAPEVKINWLAGDLEFEKCNGTYVVEAADLALKMTQAAGDWTVNLPKGKADVNDFSGVLKASGGEAAWMVQPAAGSDVSVISDSGNVQVVRRPGRTKVFLTSLTGEIRAPAELKTKNEDGVHIVEGTDASVTGAALGQLFVKTRSGAIRFW